MLHVQQLPQGSIGSVTCGCDGRARKFELWVRRAWYLWLPVHVFHLAAGICSLLLVCHSTRDRKMCARQQLYDKHRASLACWAGVAAMAAFALQQMLDMQLRLF